MNPNHSFYGQQAEWQPFPSPTATPNSDKFGPFHNSPSNDQEALFEEADRLWANMNTPSSNFSNFDLAITAHNPMPPAHSTPQQSHQRSRTANNAHCPSFEHVSPIHPAYQHADTLSFQQTTSFVQQYPPTTIQEEEQESSFLIHTPPPTRDASSRRRVLKPKSRSSTPSAGRPATMPRTITTPYMPAIVDSSPLIPFQHQQVPLPGHQLPQMYPGPHFSPEYFRPQLVQQASPQFHYASSAPTWHTSYEPPNPFDQDPFVSHPQHQYPIVAFEQQQQQQQQQQLLPSQYQPFPSSGQAAQEAQQHMRGPPNSTISLDLTPAFIPDPTPNRRISPARTGSISRTNSISRPRPIRKAASPTQRLAPHQQQLAPAAGGVDPSKLMQPRPGALARSHSFTAGAVVSGPYEHYHKEAQRERERMQGRLRAEGPSPLKRPRVNRGLVVDANGTASIVELP